MRTFICFLTRSFLACISIFLLLAPICSTLPCSSANENAPAILARAKEVWKHGNGRQAASLLHQVIKLQPDNVDAHITLGWILFTSGNQKQGLQEELKAISIDPNNWEAHHIAAGIYVELHQYPLAAHHFRLCKKIDATKGCKCGGMNSLMYLYPESSLPKNQMHGNSLQPN